MIKSISISLGGNKESYLLAQYQGKSESSIIEGLIHQAFVAAFGDVDPSTVSIERRVVVNNEGDNNDA